MLLRCESLAPPMSQMGLGRVKTSALAAHVEHLEEMASLEPNYAAHIWLDTA
jgi:hypothetical protein